MKIYVTTAGDYSDYRIEGVFSTRAKAETLSAALEHSDVAEWELDERQHEVQTIVFSCVLNRDGSLRAESSAPQLCTEIKKGERYGNGFRGLSSKSREHARKLAAEARQEWLRDQ